MDSGSGRLAITTRGENSRHLVLGGDLDSFTAPDLEAAFLGLGPTADVFVELSGVEFIDSSGLRALISAHTALEAQGHRLVLGSPSRVVSRLFDLSGLSGHVHVT